MRSGILALLLVACSSPSATIVIHSEAEPAVGIAIALDDMEATLATITQRKVVRGGSDTACHEGELHVDVRQDDTLARQQYTIDEHRCDDDGRTVVLRGGSLLATQWAVYELMEHLGVRYFHPEQTMFPAALAWPAEALKIDTQPAFARRSLHAHTTHPIELSAPLDATPESSERIQKHWVDWNVKIRATELDAVSSDVIGTYAYDRGFPRNVGINLVSSQQGSNPVLDPDDPRPEREQIATAIDAAMVTPEGAPAAATFGFQINPSEFTTVDENVTIDRLTYITNYVKERWPEVEVRTINHGTAQGPGPVTGVRFFDLSQFAPPELAVQVHTLMFYDVTRPAPVYGNADFNFLRDFMIREQAKRRIHYYPESSWWLTFDLPVPLFLAPVSLEARDHDLRTLGPYATGDDGATTGIVGHLSFSSGQEWSYWLIDYCTQRMTWDLALGWEGCLAHVAQGFTAGPALSDLLVEVGRAQVEPLRDPHILAMLVGSDDETEAATLAGIHFHPLPPLPNDVLTWDDARVAELKAKSLDPLVPMAAAYEAWAVRAEALANAEKGAGAPWILEIADGLRVTGLRARHAHTLYTTVLALRAAVNARDFAAITALEAQVEAVRGITAQARNVVHGRENFYRYPAALTIAGDEPGAPGAIANRTIYPYRYMSRTHRMFYWTRPDDQLESMFGLDTVAINDRLLVEGTALDVELLAQGVMGLDIDWGDGTTATTLAPHTYAAQGFYDWTLSALHDLGAISWEDTVAIVDRRRNFAKGTLAITSPAGAAVLNGLLPGLAVGLGTDGTGDFLAVGSLPSSALQVAKGSLVRAARSGSTSVAFDLAVELTSVGHITVYGAVVTGADGAGPTDRRLTVTGELSTEEVIQLIVATGGFDEAGARDVVAAQLGYTPSTLPARVAVTIAATGSDAA